MSEYSDKELIEQFRDPKRSSYAFNLLVRKYQERLYWHIRKMVVDHDDSDDVLQNVFIKVYKNLAGFREEADLYTWMYRIATNESITFLKKKKRRQAVSLDDVEYNMGALDADENYSGDEITKKLDAAIQTLPEKQRLIFNMKYFDEMKYEEIAEVTGTSVGALKASYHHAVKKIEKFLKPD